MTLNFVKYQGAGNDFVIIDLRALASLNLTVKEIAHICHRRLGIGADGFMTLDNDPANTDFYMRYWNSDGRESTMCGNGGRCIAHFAHSLGLSTNNFLTFNAIDGLHTAQILDNDIVKLKMTDAPAPTPLGNNAFLINTGSPHYVELITDVETLDLPKIAPALRHKHNANINFVDPKTLEIRTWERGVEDETLACGTGATAVALTLFHTQNQSKSPITLTTRCSTLTVDFLPSKIGFTDIFLTGNAKKVFNGTF